MGPEMHKAPTGTTVKADFGGEFDSVGTGVPYEFQNREANFGAVTGLTFFGMCIALFSALTSRATFYELRWPIFCIVATPYVFSRWHLIGDPRMRAFLWLMAANVFIRLVSMAWSPDFLYTFKRSVSFAILGGFVLVLGGGVLSGRGPRTVAYWLTGWLALMIVPGFFLWLSGYSVVPWSGLLLTRESGRYCGILGNPNQLGICAAVAAPVALALWLEVKTRWWALLLLVLSVWSIYMSGCRGAVVAIVVAAVAMTVVLHGWRKGSLVTLALIVALGAFFLLRGRAWDSSVDFMTRGKALQEQSRILRWSLGWQSIRKHLLLGQGYGIGGVSDRADPSQTDVDTGYALHNSFLQAWQENGLLGLGLSVALAMGVGLKLLRGRHVEPADRYVYAAFAGVAAGGLASAFFESWLFSVGNLGTLPFWTCVAVFWAMSAASHPGDAPTHGADMHIYHELHNELPPAPVDR